MIATAQNKPEQFASSIFIASKKSSGFGPEINLKNLNSYVNYNHFKMVVLSLKFISFEWAPWGGRSSLKTGSKRSLFFSASPPSLSKVCKISRETEY